MSGGIPRFLLRTDLPDKRFPDKGFVPVLSTAAAATGHKFLALDALRGIAAALVVVRHTAKSWGGPHFYHSFLAVDLFFVLSGFVISSAYGSKLHSKQMSVREFMTIRLIRLYPIYLIGACLGFLALLLENQRPDLKLMTRSLVMTLFFVPSHADHLFPLNSPFWSLFYELLLNFAAAMVVQVRSKYLMPSLAVLCAATLLTLAFFENTVDEGFIWGGTSVLIGLSRAGFGIFAGYLIYQWTAHKNMHTRDARIIIPVFLAAVGCFVLPDFDRWDWLVSAVIILFVFPGVVWAASTVQVSGGWRHCFEWLGEISYPLYALHVPLALLLMLALGGRLEHRSIWTGLLLLFALSAISMMVSRVYDKPVRRLLTRLHRERGKGRAHSRAAPLTEQDSA
jgi:peptidoglycan/LPS O-acetylase OafA/YrhL